MFDSERTKILIITSEFPPDAGGIGNHAFNLALHLAKRNFSVTVVADIVYASKQEIENTEWVRKINFAPVYRKRIVLASYYNRVQRAITLSKRSDVIFLSGKFPLWLSSMLRMLYPSKKIIAIVHGTELRERFINFNLKKCDRIIAVSNFTLSLIPSFIKTTIEICVISNGIDIDEFADAQVRPRKKTSKENLQLITVGSVTERKGQRNVINALPTIIRRFPHVCYHMVGQPVLQKELQQLAIEKNLQAHIKFYGAVSREKLIQLLADGDIKLMLSTNTSSGDVEGFGIAILEANALGIPAIGSKNTGIEDAIRNNETGILVDPKNPREVSQAIEKVLADYEFFSANAKRWAMQHDWKILIDRYIEIIESVF
ncbi:MAG TPA: glycosyltransferase family 4 protein [Parafilimonas sp.]|nr:glycosyltransferase family 4 protein [Parafilimonas sp.]